MNYGNDTFEELAQRWVDATNHRRDVAFERALHFIKHRDDDATNIKLGIKHGKANTAVVMLEEEIVFRFPGQSTAFPDGSVVRVGLPGCRLIDRLRLEVPGTPE